MAFPWDTFLVNALGSLALGFLSRVLAPSLPIAARGFLTVGLCGGFTTFSTFDLEVLTLTEAGRRWTALSYALGSAVTCVAAVYAGYMVARRFRRPAAGGATAAH
jgi:fluoride exporter